MEKFQEIRPSVVKRDDSFTLKKVDKMDPFKIEIESVEFCSKIAEMICNTNGSIVDVDDIVSEIKKPIVMRIDSDLYRTLCQIGEKDEIELVCRYIAVNRIVDCDNDKRFVGMISHVRETLKKIPLHMRHVLTSDAYGKLFGLIPAAYLSSVCNLGKVNAEVSKMDKSSQKNMKEIMNTIQEMCVCEDGKLSESYSTVEEIVERILFAYRDKNLIDLGNLIKVIKETFTGEMRDYFQKLINKMESDVNNSFTKFTDLVKQMKESDSEDMSKDVPDPMEYDPVEIPPEPVEPIQDPNNDSIVGMMVGVTDVDTNVNTGLDDTSQPDNTNVGENPSDETQQNQGVVTGLESVDSMNEAFGFKKKLKRISRDSIGYVRIRGANARDVDDLTMIVGYGYSIIERCSWYMELIEDQNPRYIVPQSYSEIELIKKDMESVVDDLLKNPIIKRRKITDMIGI